MRKHLTYIVVSIFTVLFLSCEKPEKASDQAAPAAMSNYMGDQSCAECHSTETESWQGSHHAKSMMHANDSSILGDFNNVTFTSSGTESRFFKKDSSFFVFTEGVNGQYDTFKIEFTFGVQPLQQYLVKTEKGRMQALRTAWDTQKNEWFDLYANQDLLPQDWLHWTRGGMNWNTMCAECHSTNLDKKYNSGTDSYNTSYSVINVSCESCHGPGEEHIQSVKNGNNKKYHSLRQGPGTSYLEQIRACAPCHSRKSNLTDKMTFSGEFMNDYVLSVLTDELYHADGQINDEVYVYGSFLQSKMFQNGVKCTDCHDAHSLKLKKEGNNLCLQCHENTYDQPGHTHHPSESEGSKCIDCHMAGKTYMGNDFRRDHSFRVPRPDQSVQYGTPNACNGCHTDQTPQWASKAVDEWFGKERKFHFSDVLVKGRNRTFETLPDLIGLLYDTAQPDIARATAAFYLADIPAMESVEALFRGLNDPSPLVRYYCVSGFMNFPEKEKGRVLPLLGDSIKSVRTTAANILLHYPAEQFPDEYRNLFILAVSELEKTLYNQLDFPMGHFQMAQFHYRKGNNEKALEHYQKSIEMDTMLHIARENMARIYNINGENKKAISLLQTTLSLDKNNAQSHYSLALLYAEENDLISAIDHLKKTIELEPLNERAYYNLGLAYQHSGQANLAEDTYNKGLEMVPESQGIREALSILKKQMK